MLGRSRGCLDAAVRVGTVRRENTMARYLLVLLIGAGLWTELLVPKQVTFYDGLACSPSGNYLIFRASHFVKGGEVTLFVPNVRLLRSEVIIANARGQRLSTVRTFPEATVVDTTIPRAAWAKGDRLIIERLVSGQIKGWRIYTPNGNLAGEVVLDGGAVCCTDWAISPDGRYLAYIASWSGVSFPVDYLVVKLLDSGRTAFRLPLDFHPDHLVWSSGSNRLAAVGAEFIQICQILAPPSRDEQIVTRKIRRRMYDAEIVLTENRILAVHDRGVSIQLEDEGEPVSVSEEKLQYFVFAPKDKGRFAAITCRELPQRRCWLVVGVCTDDRLDFTFRMPVSNDITGVCWGPEGSQLFYLTADGKLRTWYAETDTSKQ